MAKVQWKPGNMIYPVPAAMVSCGTEDDGYNIITIAWTGTICTNPAMAYISVRPERYSYDIIQKNGDFVINLTNKELAKATDWCGVKSGRDFDKFKEMNLTAASASKVKSPLIEECPVNIECKVTEIKELGSHHMFLAEVVAVNVSEEYLDEKTGSFDMAKAGLISYIHGKYYGSTAPLGKFGYSIQKMRRETRSVEQGASATPKSETRSVEQGASATPKSETRSVEHEPRSRGEQRMRTGEHSTIETEQSNGESGDGKQRKPRWSSKRKRRKKNKK